MARAAEDAGADALTVANTYLAMAIDTETFKPRIHNVTGGLSGPAIKPITLRLVYQCARAVKIPVIGLGRNLHGGRCGRVLPGRRVRRSDRHRELSRIPRAAARAGWTGEIYGKRGLTSLKDLMGKMKV